MSELKCAYTNKKWLTDIFLMVVDDSMPQCYCHHNSKFKLKFSLIADSCTNIKLVGKPVTHNARYYTQGAWMKDPLGIMGAETIFVMKSYGSTNVLEEFQNMDTFRPTNCLITMMEQVQ